MIFWGFLGYSSHSSFFVARIDNQKEQHEVIDDTVAQTYALLLVTSMPFGAENPQRTK